MRTTIDKKKIKMDILKMDTAGDAGEEARGLQKRVRQPSAALLCIFRAHRRAQTDIQQF